MEQNDASVWRSLAVAFGDGLAFGVGMKLTQNAARQISTPAKPDSGQLAERIEQLEQQVKRIARAPAAPSSALDQKVLDAIVAALEARLQEHSGQVERRLADLDAKITVEVRSLDQQGQSVAKQVAHDIAALKEQMVAVNREFGEAVGRIVAEQVASQVESRTADLEGELIARLVSHFEPVEGRLREETDLKIREIAGLLSTVGQLCHQAAERLEPSPASGDAAAADPAPPVPADSPEPDDSLPGFARPQKPGRLWRVPLVSSFLLTAGALVLLHYL